MGQVQSEEYQCEESMRDVADSEINSKELQDKSSTKQGLKIQDKKCSTSVTKEEQHVRKLSNVSHRNIQLLSMKPRSEKETFADNLRTRRRSSLINLILGAPSSGPRFSDDLCSLSSHLSECNFGIEFFPDTYYGATSISSLHRLDNNEDPEVGSQIKKTASSTDQNRRRSSLGGFGAKIPAISDNPTGTNKKNKKSSPTSAEHNEGKQQIRRPSLASTLASIDLTSSFERHDKSGRLLSAQFRPPLCKSKQTIIESVSQESLNEANQKHPKIRANPQGRNLRRTASELSLYSTVSAGSGTPSQRSIASKSSNEGTNPLRETKLIIILQVCLPFILAGFGNMAAGLVLNRVAQWQAFRLVPIFFVLLPPLVGMKGNIEMTLASRLSTLSNLKMLDTSYLRRRAYLSNLVLIMSQAIGLSLFATFISVLCEFLMSEHELYSDIKGLLEIAVLVVLASALATAIVLVVISSIIMSLSIGLANYIQVNPDNLSTLVAALYGDVSFVLVYGLIADWMFSLREQNVLVWPLAIVIITLGAWPILLFTAYKFKETHSIAITSLPPMLTSITVSMGSGAVLSLVVGRFKLIALYQPVVNGFGANLIAVQASRVSTWLWCSTLRRLSEARDVAETPKKNLGSLASFTTVPQLEGDQKKPTPSFLVLIAKFIKTLLWSFCNSSPNSIAARLLLIALVPAQTIYFFVIWLSSPAGYIVVTWQFYSIYIALCLLQVFILLALCEPLMTLLMSRHLDPDVFGISLLMALADLFGTLCLSGAFILLASIGDPNAV